MRPNAIRLRTVTALAMAVVAALAFAADAPATANGRTFLQLNLCGNACSSGGLEVVTDLASSVQQRRPLAVTLNEVCENQYDMLRADLVGYQGRFDPTGATCRNGARYGNAILVRATSVDLIGSWELPNPAGDEKRRLMCLRTQPPGTPPLVVCVTHISNESGNVEAQVSAVARILDGLNLNERNHDTATLVGGDFNADPADTRMDPMYSTCYPAGAGVFTEADSSGCKNRSARNVTVGSDVINEDTYARHKFDYVFLSDGDWSSVAAHVTDAVYGLSDHDALWVTTTR